MILACQNITKAFEETVILDRASFHIEENEKAAVVGINGAGKTTLFNIITGNLAPDDGVVSISKDKTLGYLEQNPVVASGLTIYQELISIKQDLIDMETQLRQMEMDMKHLEGPELSSLMDKYSTLSHTFDLMGGYSYQSECKGVLKGLGFAEEEFTKEVSTLSGGQKTRVALGKLLLQNPDIILLDEPTNHLDMNSIAWLENYLVNYKGAVIVISHDRYFINKVATKIVEIDQGDVTTFIGNYDDYSYKKEQLRAAAMNAYLKQQQMIQHQTQVIEKLKSFNREKSIKRAESREKMLEKVQVLEKPTEARAKMQLTLTPNMRSGNDVMTITDLAKSFPGNPLFDHLNFEIKRGEHVALIGDNGTGKSTLLKIINGLEEADFGEVTLGTNVSIGYYDQEHHELHNDKTIYEEISDDFPYLNITQIRTTMAAFLFTDDDVYKLIGDLSGGERGRVLLAKLMLSDCNFLIMDEPTNHLDINSREILESAINQYEGTIFYVSHDRYFINRTATRILELEHHSIHNYIGNYDYYVEMKQRAIDNGLLESSEAGASPFHVNVQETKDLEKKEEGKQDWASQKQAASRKRKLENDLKKTEEEIAQLENRDKAIDEEMQSPENCNKALVLNDLFKEKTQIQERLTELYETWEKLSLELAD
ncbi:MAG: ATP-binding cassette domain-containing protein [Lachnospiraceae bacterium]|nr:ATP-binding cassette domain-containing protein [Lachnospiraceae bacterium]